MEELVFLSNNDEPITTSRIVAEVFGKYHKPVIAKIKNLADEILSAKLDPDYNPQFTEKTYIDERGKTQPYFEMNRDAFTELVGDMSGAKARAWRRKYNAAFNRMEKALERRAFDFRSMRQITVDNTKRLHKVIQDVVIPTARANGSTTPDKVFHIHYEKLINRTIGVPAGQRPNLSYGLQSDIARLDEVVEASIVKQAQAGKTHKEIYSGTKDTIQTYAAAALLGERTENLPKFIETPKTAIKSTTVQISIF